MTKNIGVIGAGSWGTALADLLARKGYSVTLWAYEKELAASMAVERKNALYLNQISLADNLLFTDDLERAAGAEDMVLFVPPSQVFRGLLEAARPYLHNGTLLVSASKGIENDSLLTMAEIIREILPSSLADKASFISGPTFALEVANQLPAAAVAACRDEEVARHVQQLFSTDYFRVYTNTDVVGVELGGALKNVMALSCGVSDGLGFGNNARAALITRGLAEITRMAVSRGAEMATLAGLAGMGDLVLTCTGGLSRNRQVGLELGRGKSLTEILAGMKMVAEGVKTTLSAYQLAGKIGVEVPITEQMHDILYNHKDPRQAFNDLMLRTLKAE
ncbi:MAG: NAD(P)-dependent glycerol-3-phosphate dehydrogenase [Deltaproteobacteria bacterium]|nr:NAD(P)-dependent glycerol-3-phosphate dehydrogenase [Deltaproteobacteria bacterium]